MIEKRPRKMTPEACADFLDWWAEAFGAEPAQVAEPDPLLDLVLEGERRDGPTYFSRHQLETIGGWFLKHKEHAAAAGAPVLHEALFTSLFDTGADGRLETAIGVHPLLRRWEAADDVVTLFADLLAAAGHDVRPQPPGRLEAGAFQALMGDHGLACLRLEVLDQAFILRDGEDLYRVPTLHGQAALERLNLVHPLELGQAIEVRLEALGEELQRLEALLGHRF